ncbi:vacuolar import and degradation protein-domain-containing protein [Lipomyces arxii]|uniref:vacuolar import and degradation protein-domain-containing protein n=1 Tax=Lipomyces arxii TaxID=56418 RepID=UPI0034CD362C
MRNTFSYAHQAQTSHFSPSSIRPSTSSSSGVAHSHRPVLERANSSISSTASTVPQLTPSLPLWTRSSDLYFTPPSISIPVLRSPRYAAPAQSEPEPISLVSYFNPEIAMPPVPSAELSEGESSIVKKVFVAPTQLATSQKESSRRKVVSSSLPLPLESASDLIHTRRALSNSSSSFLRSGSKFIGTQQSGRSTYEVHVELKHVDMTESFICGYLHIQGLTEDHPTLTTYFEGQMIGPKYSFITRRRDWGASEKTDIAHWARFPSWRPLAKQAKRPDYCHLDFEKRDHIFMRWKECFLVPDHRVRDINGASFAGFYYICFNQLSGSISGLYFHQSSEKYQQLELSHVGDHGNYYAYEFR